MSYGEEDLTYYSTKFAALNSKSQSVDESQMFAALYSIYDEQEFSSGDIARNFEESDETIWGLFGALVSKGIYEREDEGNYRLTDKGMDIAQAVDKEKTLRIIASPEGYNPGGYYATKELGLLPGKSIEDTEFTADALEKFEK